MEMWISGGAPRTKSETVTGTDEASRDGPMVAIDASEGHITAVFDERTRSLHYPIH